MILKKMAPDRSETIFNSYLIGRLFSIFFNNHSISNTANFAILFSVDEINNNT